MTHRSVDGEGSGRAGEGSESDEVGDVHCIRGLFGIVGREHETQKYKTEEMFGRRRRKSAEMCGTGNK